MRPKGGLSCSPVPNLVQSLLLIKYKQASEDGLKLIGFIRHRRLGQKQSHNSAQCDRAKLTKQDLRPQIQDHNIFILERKVHRRNHASRMLLILGTKRSIHYLCRPPFCPYRVICQNGGKWMQKCHRTWSLMPFEILI